MRKAFTLIELLLAIFLASVVFYYLYGIVDNLKTHNAPYSKKVKQISKETRTFDLIFDDFVQHRGKIEVSTGKNYDFVKLRSINSLHNIYNPFIYYFVSKKDNTLIRVESAEDIDIQTDLWGKIYFSDIILQNLDTFKVKHNQEYLNVFLRAKDISPIILKAFVGE